MLSCPGLPVFLIFMFVLNFMCLLLSVLMLTVYANLNFSVSVVSCNFTQIFSNLNL